jgi:hypothetical protein
MAAEKRPFLVGKAVGRFAVLNYPAIFYVILPPAVNWLLLIG